MSNDRPFRSILRPTGQLAALMNPSAFADVTTPTMKAVFIHVTAGDAGYRHQRQKASTARENGTETAIRFIADVDGILAAKSAGQMPQRTSNWG
jgi:hypothetical protein